MFVIERVIPNDKMNILMQSTSPSFLRYVQDEVLQARVELEEVTKLLRREELIHQLAGPESNVSGILNSLINNVSLYFTWWSS